MRVLPKIHLVLPMLAAAALLAGCGGGSGGGSGSSKLDSTDVAIVADTHVTKVTFDDTMHQQQLSIEAQGQKFPKPGSTQYAAIKNQVVAALVQNAEFELQAEKLGVQPKPKDVDKQLTSIKKQYFGGSEKRYQQSLKQQGYTDAEVRTQIKWQLVQQNLFNKVTGDVAATPQEIHAYYIAHQSDYPPTRQVAEILVGKDKEALAKQIYEQVKQGANFAALAKKYSQDPGSKNSGGVFTAKKGQDVPEFDKAVFDPKAKKGQLLQPVNTAQYGWFVIRLLGDIKPTGEKQVASTISGQLVQQKKNQQMTDWVTRISKTYCKSGSIKYQAGYTPVPDPCTVLLSPPATTT
jgi:parvulin-like peptidyl-prolyl isomerase